MGRARKSFSAKQKLKVIAYAEIHGNRAAGRQFTVDEKSVREWRKQKDKLEKLPKVNTADDNKQAKEWLYAMQKRCLYIPKYGTYKFCFSLS